MSAISELLDEADGYPKPNGKVGFQLTRDRLINVLLGCTPALNSIVCIPTSEDDDMTSFEITLYVTFARSELEEAAE